MEKITLENIRQYAGRKVVCIASRGTDFSENFTGRIVGVTTDEPFEACIGHSREEEDGAPGWTLSPDKDVELFPAAESCKFGWFVPFERLQLDEEQTEAPVVPNNDHRPKHHVVVDMVVFRQDGNEVLLIQRGKSPFEGAYALPGGFVDFGEQTLVAAVRELREETGIDVQHLANTGWVKMVGVYDDPGRDPRGPNIGVAYTIELEDGEDEQEPVGSDDAAEARWFSMDALPELAFDHEQIISDAFRKQFEE